MRFINTLKKEVFLFLVIIIFLITAGVILWQVIPGTEEFGLNFFTEMLGVFITVIVIDQVIKYREEKKLLPIRLAIYQDVNRFTARILFFWWEAYQLSVPEDDPESLEKFLKQETFQKIKVHLYLNSNPGFAHPMGWAEYFEDLYKNSKESGDKILERYVYFLEPEVYSHVHFINTSETMKEISRIRYRQQYDRDNGVPRVNVLGVYFRGLSEKDFQSLLYLNKWCNSEYQKYKMHKKQLKYFNYEPKALKDKSLSCKTDEGILKDELEKWQAFETKDTPPMV